MNNQNNTGNNFNDSNYSYNNPPKDLLELVSGKKAENKTVEKKEEDYSNNRFIFSNSNTHNNQLTNSSNSNIADNKTDNITTDNNHRIDNTNINETNIKNIETINNNQNVNLNQNNTQANNGMSTDDLMRNVKAPKVALEIKTRKENKFLFGVVIGSGVCFALVLLVALFASGNVFSFNGKTAYYQNKQIENIGQFQTAVVTDNVYENVNVNNENDAKNLIVKDSNNQKNKCSDKNVKEVESRIENKYGIVAVNFCELEFQFASEIENVIKTVYNEFPSIKGYLTNLTLINAPNDANYIAAFKSASLFARSNSSFKSKPDVYKMSIFLNTNYFLNLEYFDYSIKDSIAFNYFPKNSTRYSLVAHEFGHYISFLAQLHNTDNIDKLILLTKDNQNVYSKLINDSNAGVFSLKMLKEAYQNYNKKYNSDYSTLDSFRQSISGYAIATDGGGNALYDETIAEAFHDYYINRDNAKKTSLEIVNVLKKYLNN